MGGMTNIKMELMPCPIFIPVSPAKMNMADAATPISPQINKMTKKIRILIPEVCFKLSVINGLFLPQRYTFCNFAAKFQGP